MPLSGSELGLTIIMFISNLYVGVFLLITGLLYAIILFISNLYVGVFLLITGLMYAGKRL